MLLPELLGAGGQATAGGNQVHIIPRTPGFMKLDSERLHEPTAISIDSLNDSLAWRGVCTKYDGL